MDREKVIKGLEICTTRPCYCTDCPYKANCALDSQNLMEEALALLKEQDEKQIPKPIVHGQMEEYWGVEEICPDCGKRWESLYVDTTYYCPGCGRRVKWE